MPVYVEEPTVNFADFGVLNPDGWPVIRCSAAYIKVNELSLTPSVIPIGSDSLPVPNVVGTKSSAYHAISDKYNARLFTVIHEYAVSCWIDGVPTNWAYWYDVLLFKYCWNTYVILGTSPKTIALSEEPVILLSKPVIVDKRFVVNTP